jgi:hypothetical protein
MKIKKPAEASLLLTMLLISNLMVQEQLNKILHKKGQHRLLVLRSQNKQQSN